jgi:hypothetical protein
VRFLITGGSGFLGSALASRLLRDGHEVVVLTRDGGAASVVTGARALPWDGRSAGTWWREADGCEAIVHLAGENIGGGRWTRSRKERIRASRLESGAALVEAIGHMRRRPSVLVQSSGVGYYGEGGAEVLTESAPVGGDFLGRLAAQWETSTAAVEGLGVRRAMARTGLVLAAHGGALPRMALPFRAFVGGRLAGGNQWLPWIHLEDEVQALRFLVETAAARGPFNLVAPGIVRQLDFARLLAAALRRPCWLPVPAVALRIALGEMADLLLRSQRAVPAALGRLGFRFQFPELAGAFADIYGSD